MMFVNGRHAVMYYAEFRENPVRFPCSTERIVKDGGAHLGYDANTPAGYSTEIERVETMIDLAAIFRRILKPAQMKFALQWALGKFDNLEPEGDFKGKAEEISRSAISHRLKTIFNRVEQELIKHDYCQKGVASCTGWT